MTTINVDQYCRLCLNGQFSLLSIYSVLLTTGKIICDVLNDVFDLEIRKDDALSSKICTSCLLKTIQFDMFKKQVLRSEKEMKNLLEYLRKDSDEVGVVKSKVMLGNDADGISKEIESEPTVEQAANDANSILDENPIKQEIEEEESSVQQDLPTKLFITDIPTKEDLDIEEWSNPESIAPKRTEFAESNEGIVRNDVRSEGKDNSKESSVFVDERDLHERNQVNVIDNTQEEVPCEIRERGRGRPRNKPDEGYCCDICKKCFKTKQTIQFHMVTHSEDRPYVCVMCNKGFKLSNYLRRHQLMHKKHELESKSGQDKKNFRCSTCGRCYASKGNLYKHSWIHTSKYACTICQKRFESKKGLKSHILTHTKERPFACEICDKRFGWKTSLKHHVQIHADVSNFKCLTCGKSFKTRNYLNQHKLIHLK